LVLAVIEVHARYDVGVAVAVDVARPRHGEAEAGISLVAFGHPVGAAAQPRGRAVVHEGPPLVRRVVVEVQSPDDDVRIAVAIDVARARNGVAERAETWLLSVAQSGLAPSP